MLNRRLQELELLDRLVVIGGAPKAATTSLANMLHRNPGISVSQPKEPCYFGEDLEISRKRLRLHSQKDYLRCFHHAMRNGVLAYVDATTLYYASRYAVDEICASSKRAKFIFVIRDPVEMLYSWHSHLLTYGAIVQDVDIPFIVSENFIIPKSKRIGVWDDLLFDCHRMVSLGTQATELINKVDVSRILFVDYRSLVHSTRDQYLKILEFIGIQDDGQKSLPKDNVAHEFRSPLIRSVAMNSVVRRLATTAKRQLPEKMVSWIRQKQDVTITKPRSTEHRQGYIDMLASTEFLKNERILLNSASGIDKYS